MFLWVELYPQLSWRTLFRASVTCAGCRSQFARGTPDENRQIAERLDSEYPTCACQNFRMSDLSTGPVLHEEVLLRILVAPQHRHKKKPLPRAACLTDAESSGLSVLRMTQATDEHVRNTAIGLVERARINQAVPDKAGVFGVLQMTAREIRYFIAEGETDQCYCVYDTAEPSLECHAEAFQRVAGSEDTVRSNRRRGLFELVRSSFIPVEDFRHGLLADLAPKQL